MSKDNENDKKWKDKMIKRMIDNEMKGSWTTNTVIILFR